MQAMKNWHKSHPHLFVKSLRNHAGRDSYAGYSSVLDLRDIHSMMVVDCAGHIAISAPSPYSTFAYDPRTDATVGFMTQEDGCLVHKWDAGFQSVRIGLVAGAGPFPF